MERCELGVRFFHAMLLFSDLLALERLWVEDTNMCEVQMKHRLERDG